MHAVVAKEEKIHELRQKEKKNMHTLRTKRKIYVQLEAETPPGPFDFLMALGFCPGEKPYFALAEVGKIMKVLRDIPRHHKSVLRYPCCVGYVSYH